MYTRKEVEKLLKNYDTMDDVKPGSGIHVRMADLRKAWYRLTHQEQLVLFYVGIATVDRREYYFPVSFTEALTSLVAGMNG